MKPSTLPIEPRLNSLDDCAPDINWPDPDWIDGYPREARWAMAPDILADHLRRLGFSMERRHFADDDFSAAVVPMHTAMTAKSPSTNVLLVTEEYVDRERRHAECLRARAEKAEADLARAVEERTQVQVTASRHLDRIQSLEAELAALTAERKADAVDALQQAILETLQTLASAWPKAEIPSSRLWAAVVDRGAVATVRPGQAAECEAHRFYRAKMALIRDGLITESRGFVRLASAPSSAESEPTFRD